MLRRWGGVLLRWALWVALVLVIWHAVRVLARVDWHSVGSALSLLTWWQCGILLLLVVWREVCSSAPLAMFTEDLGLRRAIANDLVGNLTATITPAPADIVARAALFRTWNVSVAQGLAGLVLNSTLFYAVRLGMPVLGAAILLWVGDESATLGWTAALSGIAAVVIAVTLSVVVGSSRSASAVGLWAGKCAEHIRSSWPGPQEMKSRLLTFQSNISERWKRHGLAAAGFLTLMALTESVVLVIALRFVGVSAASAPTLVIIGAHRSLYLLTAAPFQGIGVMDGALVATIAAHAPAQASTLIAGVIIWRVTVQLVPLLAGIIPATALRHVTKESFDLKAAASAGADDSAREAQTFAKRPREK